MKAIKSIGRCCAAISLGILCGCETVTVPPTPSPGTVHLPPDTPVLGKPGDATIYELKRLVKEILDEIKADNDFMETLKAMKTEKGEKPDLVVAYVDNESHDGDIRAMCRPMRNYIIEGLKNLVSLRIDDNSIVLAPRILSDINGGNKDANKRITPDSLDLYLCILVEKDPRPPSDGFHWYAINATMHNLHTGRMFNTWNRSFYKK